MDVVYDVAGSELNWFEPLASTWTLDTELSADIFMFLCSAVECCSCYYSEQMPSWLPQSQDEKLRPQYHLTF